MARLRSPNFPALTLEDALKAAAILYGRVRKATVDREAAAKELGYSGLTGWSLKVLGALNQYGLIDNVGKGQCRVTDLTEQAIHGFPDAEKRGAIQKAARMPVLFQAIFEEFGLEIQSEHAIRSFLLKRGFSDSGAESALQSFLATQRFAEVSSGSSSVPQDVAPSKPEVSDEEIAVLSRSADGLRRTVDSLRLSSGVIHSRPIFRDQPLEFSLSSKGLAITGKTNSALELREFIKKLEALAALLPEIASKPQDEEEVDAQEI